MMNANRRIFYAVLAVTLATGGFLSGEQKHSQQTPGGSNTATQPNGTTHDDKGQDEGERLFAQNCSRCHNAPEGFSPRIARTITKHMRVRANLSREDERALLKFFNP